MYNEISTDLNFPNNSGDTLFWIFASISYESTMACIIGVAA